MNDTSVEDPGVRIDSASRFATRKGPFGRHPDVLRQLRRAGDFSLVGEPFVWLLDSVQGRYARMWLGGGITDDDVASESEIHWSPGIWHPLLHWSIDTPGWLAVTNASTQRTFLVPLLGSNPSEPAAHAANSAWSQDRCEPALRVFVEAPGSRVPALVAPAQ